MDALQTRLEIQEHRLTHGTVTPLGNLLSVNGTRYRVHFAHNRVHVVLFVAIIIVSKVSSRTPKQLTAVTQHVGGMSRHQLVNGIHHKQRLIRFAIRQQRNILGNKRQERHVRGRRRKQVEQSPKETASSRATRKKPVES